MHELYADLSLSSLKHALDLLNYGRGGGFVLLVSPYNKFVAEELLHTHPNITYHVAKEFMANEWLLISPNNVVLSRGV